MKSESEMIEKAVGQEVACGLEGEVCGMKQRLEDRYFGGGYREYLAEYNPDLIPCMGESMEGSCVRYDTELGNAYILHRIVAGQVDLVFPGTASSEEALERPWEWLRELEFTEISVCREGGLSVFRIEVPKQDTSHLFQKSWDVDSGYDAVAALMDIAVFAADLAALASKK